MSARIWLLTSFEKNRVYVKNNEIIDFSGWLKMKLLNQFF